MTTDKRRRCPSCQAGELQPTSYEEIFKPRGKEVRVNLLSSECSACGARFTSGSQHDENLKRLDLRRAEYGDVLLGEDIVAFRMRYGITQTAAAKVFGKSKIDVGDIDGDGWIDLLVSLQEQKGDAAEGGVWTMLNSPTLWSE